MAYRDQPLGELALSIPRASALFRKYDMDYCCGGKQTLARAAARKELDVEVIEAELAKLAEQPIEKDWRSAPLAEIIDHIIVRYHDRHREQPYTSLLHADTSPLGLADEHIETEKMLADSGIVYTLLRNGWYSENYLASAPAALEHGVFIGAAGDGKIASATRADYAAAAARVISEAGHEGKVYELAGDSAWTLTQLAAELTKQSGKQVTYQNLSEADFAAALKSVGLPDGLADMLADSDVGASKGGLFDDSKTLSKLIGHPTTTLAESVSHLFNVNN